jgi:hypothetical protein
MSLSVAVIKTRHIFANVMPAVHHPNILVAHEMTPRLSHMNVVSVKVKHFIV